MYRENRTEKERERAATPLKIRHKKFYISKLQLHTN